MAKRKKKAAKVPVVEDVLGEAGITGYGRKVAERNIRSRQPNGVRWYCKRPMTIRAACDPRLDRIEQAAREVIVPHVSPLDETGNVPAGCKLTGLDLGGRKASLRRTRPASRRTERSDAGDRTH